MVTTDGVVGIDHALSWTAGFDEAVDGSAPKPPAVVGAFADHYLSSDRHDWASTNDMSPDDMRTIRSRLEAVRADFELLDRAYWWNSMMARLF